MERYSEENSFHPIYFILVLLAFIFAAGVILSASNADSRSLATAVAIALPVLLLVLNIPYLRTTVTSEQVRVRLGRIVPIWWRNIGIDEIETMKVVDLGRRRLNLGAHFILFGGHFTLAMLYGSPRAVYIERKRGYRVLIGSEKPEALVAAIEREREKLTR